MMRVLTRWVHKLINEIQCENYFNIGLSIGRSSLALSTLLTLIANDSRLLFDQRLVDANNKPFVFRFFDVHLNLFKIFGDAHQSIGVIIASIILISVIAGFMPRVTGILHWYTAYSFVTSAAIIDGGDQIISNLTLIVIPLTLFDCRKNHWNFKGLVNYPNGNIWLSSVVLILRLQVAAIYFHAGIEKLSVGEWSNGTALYYWLQDPYFGASDAQWRILSPILTTPIILVISTWSIMALELLLSFALFMHKRYYKPLFWIGAVMHLSFLIFLGLFSFFFAMVGALSLYLLLPFYSMRASFRPIEEFKLSRTTDY